MRKTRPTLSDRQLLLVLHGYLESHAGSSNTARVLHSQLGPKLVRIIAGELPSRVLHTKTLGRPVALETQIKQSLIAYYIALRVREDEDCTTKQAVAEVARELKLTNDEVLNARRASSDDTMMMATCLFEVMSGTPLEILKNAYAAQIPKAKKTLKKLARGK